MAWGNRDTKDNVILTGIDAALLENYRLRDGATYAEVVAWPRPCWARSMPAWLADPFWSLLVSYTDQPETRYAIGSAGDGQAHTSMAAPTRNAPKWPGTCSPSASGITCWAGRPTIWKRPG
jgi:hypothetical protein